MSTLPAGITLKMVHTLAFLDRMMKLRKAQRERLAYRFKEAFPAGTYVFEGRLPGTFVTFTRTDADVVDSQAIAEKYPAEKFPQYYKPTLDMSKVPEGVKKDFTSSQKRISVKEA